MSREMPHDVEAERSVLGAMLINKSVAVEMLTSLTAEDFYIDRHQVIFENMVSLHDKNMGIDITTLTAQLRDVNALDKAGGVDYLLSISESVPTTLHSKYYMQIIMDKAILRKLITQATTMIEEASSGEIEDIGDFISDSEKNLLAVTRDRNYGEFKDAKSVVENVTNRLYQLQKSDGVISGRKTKFKDLDRMTAGLQKGDLFILAARPAVGKTAFALNIAHNVAYESQDAVAMFSLEMPAEQLITRIISSMGGIEGSDLKTGNILKTNQNLYHATAEKVMKLNLYIDDSPGIKINEIVAKCRRLKQERGLCLVVIDYLQLITGSGKESRQQEISDISRQLKILARELEVPVIALSQLSRSVEKREDKRPMLSDLRESGAIEQDADIVAFLYREDYYNNNKNEQDQSAPGIVELNLAKHRNGETGKVLLAFEKNYSRFSSLSTNENPTANKDVRV